MKSLSIEGVTIDEFKEIVTEIISKQLKEYSKGGEKEVQYISRKEAAKLLDCSINTLDDWTLKGYLKQYRFGSTIKYLKHEVEEAGPNIVRRRKGGGDA